MPIRLLAFDTLAVRAARSSCCGSIRRRRRGALLLLLPLLRVLLWLLRLLLLRRRRLLLLLLRLLRLLLLWLLRWTATFLGWLAGRLLLLLLLLLLLCLLLGRAAPLLGWQAGAGHALCLCPLQQRPQIRPIQILLVTVFIYHLIAAVQQQEQDGETASAGRWSLHLIGNAARMLAAANE